MAGRATSDLREAMAGFRGAARHFPTEVSRKPGAGVSRW